MDCSDASNLWWFKLGSLIGFVRKMCFYHYIFILIYKQVHHIVAITIHFTLVTFKIMVLIGRRRKLIWDVRKNNVRTPLLSRTQWDWVDWMPHCSSTFQPHSLSQGSHPWHCKYLSFSRYTVVQSRSLSKFGNSPVYICKRKKSVIEKYRI
jgi:hypothetical protein